MWQIRIYDMTHFWENNYEKMELIKEVKEEPPTEGIIEIDGKTYRFCACSPKNKVFGVKEIVLNKNPKEEVDGDFICPYCGSEDYDAWEHKSDSDTIECGICDSEIKYERHVEVTYTVSPVKKAKITKIV
jgi:formylmethanofuran dehydrogenase subunit E